MHNDGVLIHRTSPWTRPEEAHLSTPSAPVVESKANGAVPRIRQPLPATRFALLTLIAAGAVESVFSQQTGGATIERLAGALCFGVFAVEAGLGRHRLRVDRTHAILLAFLLLSMLSTVAATDSAAAIATTIRYGSYGGLYLVMTQMRLDGPFPRRLAWTLTAAWTVTATSALVRFLAGDSLSAVTAYGDSNDMAYGIATALPFGIWLATRRRGGRLLAAACVLVLAATLVFSFSRGGLVAAGGGLVWYMLTHRRGGRAVFAAILAAAVAVIPVVWIAGGALTEGLSAKQKVASANVANRLEAYQAAIDLTVSHPVLGVGPGNFAVHYHDQTDRPIGTPGLDVSHDAFLDVAAENGLPALALFIWFLVVVARRARMAERERRGPPAFASATCVALVIALVGTIPISGQYLPPLWMLAGIATAVARAPATERTP